MGPVPTKWNDDLQTCSKPVQRQLIIEFSDTFVFEDYFNTLDEKDFNH